MTDSPSPAGLPPSPQDGGRSASDCAAKFPFDYSSLPAEPAIPAPTLADLARLVESARDAEMLVVAREAQLADAKAEHRRITEVAIPEAMAAAGMETFRTSSGLTVTIKDDVQVKQPPVAQRAQAYAWLEENGQGGLVKRSVEIAFGAGETEAERAHALVDLLGPQFPGSVREGREVNSSSLAAWLRRAIEAGESPPLELLGARQVRVAKIKRA